MSCDFVLALSMALCCHYSLTHNRQTKHYVKGALCSFGEVIQLWVKKLFSEENTVPRTLFEARKVVDSAKYKQSKQYENVLSFTVSLLVI